MEHVSSLGESEYGNPLLCFYCLTQRYISCSFHGKYEPDVIMKQILNTQFYFHINERQDTHLHTPLMEID